MKRITLPTSKTSVLTFHFVRSERDPKKAALITKKTINIGRKVLRPVLAGTIEFIIPVNWLMTAKVIPLILLQSISKPVIQNGYSGREHPVSLDSYHSI